MANGNIMVMVHQFKKNQLINGNGNGKYSKINGNGPLGRIFTITQAWLIQHILILPFGTASVERDFSLVNIIKSKLRNRLSVDTLYSLIRVREFLPDKFCDFVPTQRMYDLFNVDIYKKSIEELKNSNLVHEEIEFLNPTEAFLR